MSHLPYDPAWPRASQWLADGTLNWGAEADLGVLGVPAHSTSLSPTNAHETPTAVRKALARYSTWCESAGVDVGQVRVTDLGDVVDPDHFPQRVLDAVSGWQGKLLVALGGDNSLTYPVAQGAAASGMVTLDAHHDLRDGHSNGSPVRELLDSGMPAERVVQVGIADFSNSRVYAQRARDCGITVITRAEVGERGIAAVMLQALDIAGGGGGRIHVDVDVDVCDRSVVPACPAAAPGGLSAWELRLTCRLAAADPRVRSLDFAEVDATADTEDERTVRLVAVCLLEVAAGLALR